MARPMPSILVLLTIVALVPGLVRAQSPADTAAIRTAALDYIEGWYTADVSRMERALHPAWVLPRSNSWPEEASRPRQTPCTRSSICERSWRPP